MRAELHRPDAPDLVVAVATWSAGGPELEVLDPSVRGLADILRPTPVSIDDPALRRFGTSGPSVLQPGGLQWFRAALETRAPELGLGVRFIRATIEGGWDPAAQYRTFEQRIERLTEGPPG